MDPLSGLILNFVLTYIVIAIGMKFPGNQI